MKLYIYHIIAPWGDFIGTITAEDRNTARSTMLAYFLKTYSTTRPDKISLYLIKSWCITAQYGPGIAWINGGYE